MNIGLIGTGAIGKFLLEKLNDEEMLPGYKITARFDERRKNEYLQKTGNDPLPVYHELDRFLASGIDIVVECANVAVAEQYAAEIVKKKDLLLISVGALADPLLYKSLKETAKENNRKVYLPSGAIGGLDVLRAASMLGGLETVTLETRKPAATLGADTAKGEVIVFDGPASEAIRAYPENANIAIIISLSGIGAEQTRVKIISDPQVEKNIHKLHAAGDFGKLELKLENDPSPANPKTSYLTALSILSALHSLDNAVKIGG